LKTGKITEQPPPKEAIKIAETLSKLGFNIHLLGSQKYVLNKLKTLNSEINRIYDEKLDKGEISVDEWAEKTTDTEFEIGLDDTLEELRKAEDRLIDLGRKVLEQNLTEEQKRKVAVIWEYCKFSPIREKVIDALLRLQP
jgi:methionyl-tRNA formyltransferase